MSGHFAFRTLSYTGTVFAYRFHDLSTPNIRKFPIFFVVDARLPNLSSKILWMLQGVHCEYHGDL